MSVIKSAYIVLFAVAGICISGTAHAYLYVYKTPDGSMLYTDHAIHEKNYKLLRAGSIRGSRRQNSDNARVKASTTAYDRLIKQFANEHEVDFALVKAVMHAESAFNPRAKSHKGALGLMQLMPQTAKQYGVRNAYDPGQNIEAGVRHLRYLQSVFQHRHSLVLAAYNAGEQAVQKYNGIPPYTETQEYVIKVLQYLRQYRQF